MRVIRKYFYFLLLFLIECQNQRHPAWPYGVHYKISIEDFADSNKDGTGDINGITDQLEYLSELGIGGIDLWGLTSSQNRNKSDSIYGTTQDLEKLIREAHSRNIHIIISIDSSVTDLIKTGKSWISEMGIDGFHINTNSPDFILAMRKLKPDVYIATGNPGLDWDQIWGPADEIRKAISSEHDTSGIISNYIRRMNIIKKSKPDYIPLHSLGHMQYGSNSTEHQKIAAGIMFTLPGIPFIVYSEEIGISCCRNYRMSPFLWMKDNIKTRDFLVQTIPTEPLSIQRRDKNSMFHFYKEWIRYRNENEVLTYGTIETTPLSITQILSFIRRYKDNSLLILNNIGDVEITIRFPKELMEYQIIDFNPGLKASFSEEGLIIPSHTTVILRR